MKEPVIKPNTQVIEFPDGNWWQVHSIVTRGMRKAVGRAAMDSYTVPESAGIDPTDISEIQGWLMNHPQYLDINKKDDTLLIVGSVDWSWDEPITIENIDSKPDSITGEVLIVLEKLFVEISENLLASGVES